MVLPLSPGEVLSVTTVPAPVLIATRDGAIGRMMEMALWLEGYQPKLCTDGRQALEALLQGHWAVAVLDTHLPTVDGLAICERVRASMTPVSSVPIILLLVEEDAPAWQAHQQRLQINAALFIPFQVRELLAEVAAVLGSTTGQSTPPPEG